MLEPGLTSGRVAIQHSSAWSAIAHGSNLLPSLNFHPPPKWLFQSSSSCKKMRDHRVLEPTLGNVFHSQLLTVLKRDSSLTGGLQSCQPRYCVIHVEDVDDLPDPSGLMSWILVCGAGPGKCVLACTSQFQIPLFSGCVAGQDQNSSSHSSHLI